MLLASHLRRSRHGIFYFRVVAARAGKQHVWPRHQRPPSIPIHPQAQKACDYLQQKALVAAPLASARETTTEPEPAMVIPASRKRLAR